MAETFTDVKYELIPANLSMIYENLKYEVFYEYLEIAIVHVTLNYEVFIGYEDWQTYFWQTCIR